MLNSEKMIILYWSLHFFHSCVYLCVCVRARTRIYTRARGTLLLFHRSTCSAHFYLVHVWCVLDNPQYTSPRPARSSRKGRKCVLWSADIHVWTAEVHNTRPVYCDLRNSLNLQDNTSNLQTSLSEWSMWILCWCFLLEGSCVCVCVWRWWWPLWQCKTPYF